MEFGPQGGSFPAGVTRWDSHIAKSGVCSIAYRVSDECCRVLRDAYRLHRATPRMRLVFDATYIISHPEEVAQQPSRRTQTANAANSIWVHAVGRDLRFTTLLSNRKKWRLGHHRRARSRCTPAVSMLFFRCFFAVLCRCYFRKARFRTIGYLECTQIRIISAGSIPAGHNWVGNRC